MKRGEDSFLARDTTYPLCHYRLKNSYRFYHVFPECYYGLEAEIHGGIFSP